LMEPLEGWARQNHCDAIEIQGRKGWGRIFPEYRPSLWCYTKALTE